MPVGNSSSGVGLWAGQMMFTMDNTNQYVDWWHEAIPGSKETFSHEGTLTSILINPSITIGLTNYWNITLSQSFGNRFMNWEGDSLTIHHRDEGTHTDFKNAIGGLVGDSRITMKYLVFNDGQGAGKRLFLGGGLVIPSTSTLKSDPFFLNGEPKEEHRHFSLSQGVYKGVLEIQFFKKRDSNPVFLGGTVTSDFPLHINKYGFKSSKLYNVSLNAFTKEVSKIKGSLGLSASLRHTTKSYWNDIEAPNSEATILTLGGGGIWNLSNSVLGLNFQKPFFLVGGFSGVESKKGQGQKVSAFQVSVSYRKLFDFVIPWLDPLNNL